MPGLRLSWLDMRPSKRFHWLLLRSSKRNCEKEKSSLFWIGLLIIFLASTMLRSTCPHAWKIQPLVQPETIGRGACSTCVRVQLFPLILFCNGGRREEIKRETVHGEAMRTTNKEFLVFCFWAWVRSFRCFTILNYMLILSMLWMDSRVGTVWDLYVRITVSDRLL